MRRYYYTSKKNGMDKVCDICGKTEYFKRIKGHEYLNGRLTPEEYEGEGLWGYDSANHKDYCPECSGKSE